LIQINNHQPTYYELLYTAWTTLDQYFFGLHARRSGSATSKWETWLLVVLLGRSTFNP